MEETFLPAGYQAPAGSSNYLRLQQGANKFRIMSKSITGWEDWTNERKPLRTKDYPVVLVDQTKPAKHFWAFVVWDYKDNEIKILELTQRTIQDAIMALYLDENWGDPKKYDLTITKTGEKMETKYNVMPTPPRPVAGEIEAVYIGMNINLEALYSGGDPFGKKQTTERQVIEQSEINRAINPNIEPDIIPLEADGLPKF